jgi:energy-converting hydrogenase Eha subunit H
MITMEITPERINIGDIVFTSISLLLVILVCVALTVSIRKLSKDQKKKAQNSRKIEQKLDKIIALLEQKEIDK